MNADGKVLTANQNDPLMKAVIGGLGLIGVIVEITLKLKKLPSFFIKSQNPKSGKFGMGAPIHKKILKIQIRMVSIAYSCLRVSFIFT